MMLSKDLQDLLEGMHHFLSEVLVDEKLSSNAECARQGLMTQLESLTPACPALRFPAYLVMDPPGSHGVAQVGESGGSSSSGGQGTSEGDSGLITQEYYEDFTDNQEEDEEVEEPVERLREPLDDRDEAEDVYMESVEKVPFSKIIASCNKHGSVAKKTKGFLRKLRTYQCVAANGLLYLYHKDSDEKQCKTIDLTGYCVRAATGEDIKDQRKRDSAFEIVGPGRKTHTFISRTARDKLEWMAALVQTIKSGRNTSLTASCSPMTAGSSNSLPARLILTHQPIPKPEVKQTSEEYFYYHDIADDTPEDDEMYEEVGVEEDDEAKLSPPPPLTPAPQPPPAFPHQLQDYDSVGSDDGVIGMSPLPAVAKKPPERPPLPAFLQNRICRQIIRPLPEAPADPVEVSEDLTDIYCEIDEDSFDSTTEIQDDPIRCRTSDTPSGGEAQNQPDKISRNSLVGFLSDEILSNISELSCTSTPRHKFRYLEPELPPKLPPKGIMPTVDDDDSEYKVPVVHRDEEYQIPPPVSVPTVPEELNKTEVIEETSSSIVLDSHVYEVPPSESPRLSAQSLEETPEEHLTPSKVKSHVLSQTMSAKECATANRQPSTESNISICGSSQRTSVKDMIARLNKNKADTTDTIKTKTHTDTSNKVDAPQGSLVTSSKEPTKPHLPPRPANLNGNILRLHTLQPIQDAAATESESDDYYENPDSDSTEPGAPSQAGTTPSNIEKKWRMVCSKICLCGQQRGWTELQPWGPVAGAGCKGCMRLVEGLAAGPLGPRAPRVSHEEIITALIGAILLYMVSG